MTILTILLFVPFIAAITLFFLPGLSGFYLRRLALLFSVIPLVLLISHHGEWVGMSLEYPWLNPLAITFHVQVDPLSLLFLYLTAVIIPLSLLATKREELVLPNLLYGLVLLLQGLLMVFFTARNLVVFTIFWEAMLLPLYFIINLWGGKERQQASLKFLIYTIAGSTLMIMAVLALYADAAISHGIGSFNLDVLTKTAAIAPHANLYFAIFMLAFAVKTPLFPFHAWLPDAYCQAPTTGSILLAALLSKAGVYGILRIGMELFPSLLREWSPLLLGLSIAGVLYGGLAAFGQKDFKRLISYSSFAHVNFILVGLFIWNDTSHMGAILQALNHSVTIAALFFVAWWLEKRLGSTEMNEVNGLAHFLPRLTWITLFFVLSSIALPGTNNFIGEFLIFFGLFGQHPWLTALLGLTIILSAIYMLSWIQNMYFGKPRFFQDSWIDLRRHELVISLPFIAWILWVGIYPQPLLEHIEPASHIIIEAKSDGNYLKRTA